MDTKFLNDIEKLRLTMKRKIHTKYFGEKESLETGVGTVFKDFKVYVPGEDFRKIDWKIYARSNELFVKRYEEERTRMIHVLQDSSSSMRFKYSGKETKFQFASKIALGLIYLAMKGNEKYRYASFSDKIEITTHSSGLKQLMHHIDSIKAAGTSSLQFAHAYKKFIDSKSMVFLISDFLFSIEDLKNFLNLYKKHNIFLVHIYDKIEEDLNLKGSVIIEDLETNTDMKTYLGKKVIDEYKKRYTNHFNEIKRLCKSHNAKLIEANTSKPLIDVFYEIVGEIE